jgi:hypothetical protein
MKLKTFSKKLILNKRTIAHLDIKKMKNLYGGKPLYTPIPNCCTIGTSEIFCCTGIES